MGSRCYRAAPLRPPVEIAAPPFPRDLPWVNVAPLRMDKQIGRPVLVEFWDSCRANSMRTLPYLREWHRRYADAGLRVVGVHTSGFPPSAGEAAVRGAVARLGVDWPVVVDVDAQVWRLYENPVWPARYLWDQEGRLFDYHHGEGAYDDTERAIQQLLGVSGDPVEPVRPEDVPGAELVPQSADREGPWSGPYAAGGVWAVLDGTGSVRANGRDLAVPGAGAYPLLEHDRHTEGELELDVGDGVTCWAVCFTPGVR
jgi:thiol-disulfide isomerase/thioredoxin